MVNLVRDKFILTIDKTAKKPENWSDQLLAQSLPKEGHGGGKQ